ncbi:MAG: hypothetical protein QOJ41_1551, partial [Acidobacteriaceae bacterium]|nr:hypothetical protein [Acidobacteriaceae bacterium]
CEQQAVYSRYPEIGAKGKRVDSKDVGGAHSGDHSNAKST